ncbi:MAG: hypothetical protein BGO69_00520 [Bacteroidetes bacterium 46-16]|nr:MAG: hypothetical protein BGO69_00520 [Bacteroidetes bacterium 46-16]
MKKLAFIIAFIFSLTAAHGQIVLEHIFNPEYNKMTLIKLDAAGYKYVGNTYFPPALDIYNTDYSLYRSIQIPQYPNLICSGQVDYVSDHLFNSDDLIEYAVWYFTNNNSEVLKVINENGVELLSVPGDLHQVYWDGNGHYKMVVQAQWEAIFSLCAAPGSVPCVDDCPTMDY